MVGSPHNSFQGQGEPRCFRLLQVSGVIPHFQLRRQYCETHWCWPQDRPVFYQVLVSRHLWKILRNKSVGWKLSWLLLTCHSNLVVEVCFILCRSAFAISDQTSPEWHCSTFLPLSQVTTQVFHLIPQSRFHTRLLYCHYVFWGLTTPRGML